MILDTTRPYNADASAIESLTDTITFPTLDGSAAHRART